MSLILDALKKSDRERRIAEGQPFAAANPVKKRSWLMRFGFILAFGALAILALWVWRGGGAAAVSRLLNSDSATVAQQQAGEAAVTPPALQGSEPPEAEAAAPGAPDNAIPENPPKSPKLTAAAAPAAAGETLPEAPVTASPAPEKTPAQLSARQSAMDKINSRRRQRDGQRTASVPAETPAQPSARQSAQDRISSRRRQRDGQRTASVPAEPPPMELYQLPMGIRLQVPPITMNVHVYATQPEDRFVLLNMQRIEEGDELEGLVARAIRPDGVLLEFQGHQFLLRRP